MAAAIASPWPVLPEVGSTIVPPGLRAPDRSAASIMRRPMRSFTLPPGFSISSLARIVGLTPRVTAWSRTRGVSPIASRKLSRTSTGSLLTFRPDRPSSILSRRDGGVPAGLRGEAGRFERQLARHAQEEPLAEADPQRAQRPELGVRLDALRDHRRADLRGERDERGGQGPPSGIGVDVARQRLIELDEV